MSGLHRAIVHQLVTGIVPKQLRFSVTRSFAAQRQMILLMSSKTSIIEIRSSIQAKSRLCKASEGCTSGRVSRPTAPEGLSQ
jgi:hypothetical protein